MPSAMIPSQVMPAISWDRSESRNSRICLTSFRQATMTVNFTAFLSVIGSSLPMWIGLAPCFGGTPAIVGSVPYSSWPWPRPKSEGQHVRVRFPQVGGPGLDRAAAEGSRPQAHSHQLAQAVARSPRIGSVWARLPRALRSPSYLPPLLPANTLAVARGKGAVQQHLVKRRFLACRRVGLQSTPAR